MLVGCFDFGDQFFADYVQVGGNRSRRFGHIIESSQLQSFERGQRPFLRQGAEHNHRHPGMLFKNMEHGGHAVHRGHVDVHGDDIGRQLAVFLDGVLPVPGQADHFKFRGGIKDCLDHPSHHGRLFHYQNFYLLRHTGLPPYHL